MLHDLLPAEEMLAEPEGCLLELQVESMLLEREGFVRAILVQAILAQVAILFKLGVTP